MVKEEASLQKIEERTLPPSKLVAAVLPYQVPA